MSLQIKHINLLVFVISISYISVFILIIFDLLYNEIDIVAILLKKFKQRTFTEKGPIVLKASFYYYYSWPI